MRLQPIVYLVTLSLAISWNTPALAAKPSVLPKTSTDLKTHDKQDILYMLLVAELAANRNLRELALSHYIKAAEITQDPKIAQQATQMAIEYQAPAEAIQTSEMWAKTDPNNLKAQMIAMTLLIGLSTDKAIPYLTRAIEIDPLLTNQNLSEIQVRLSEKGAKQLTKALNTIAEQRTNDPYAQLIAAQSTALQGNISEANERIDSALKLKPDLTPALELKARLIRHEDTTDAKALDYLKEKVKEFPNNAELRIFYASALIDSENYTEAKDSLLQLADDKTFGGQALLFLGEIDFKANQFESAKEYLLKAKNFPSSKDTALYLLGMIDERLGNEKEAIRSYSGIGAGQYQILGVLKAVALLKKNEQFDDAVSLLHESSPSTVDEQKQILFAEIEVLMAAQKFDEAMTLADELLPKLPEDPDMLFIHSLTAAKVKNWSAAESDLKQILRQNPNNANALNAMGYVLISQNKRLEEASRYLSEALALSPNNPSIMDSMGWVEYRLGNISKALEYLKKANQLSDDSDIATHLGEVLWVSGDKENAKMVWAKALQKTPRHTDLLNTLKRYNVDIK